ncbi:MAG: transport-associated protein [Bryobacterales bacterium]|jgi:hyperosmotically inducible protein|nr:transport-associated protein [Bryobacterales bacterium]
MLGTVRSITRVCCVALPLALFASPQQPDNTRENKNNSPTADQQKETKGDRELAAKIRKSITSDKSLSTYAHNVKVIAQNGEVTLKGPVRSEQESQAIQAKAQEVAGSAKIHNELTVAPPKSKKSE